MKKFLLIFFTIIITILPSYAEIEKISIDEAVNKALENNLSLQAKRKEINVLEQEVKMANALKNPQFQSNVLVGSIAKSNASQLGAAIPVEISKRGVRKKAALANLNLIQNEVRQAEHDLKINVMNAYFEVLYMKSVVAIMQQRELLYKNLKFLTETKSTTSNNYEIDKLQADIKYKKQIILLNKAKADLLYAQFHLNNSLNLESTETMYDAKEESLFAENISLLNITLPEYSVIEEIATKFSYSIRIADNNIEKSEKELDVAGHKVIPDLTLVGGYAFSHERDNLGGYVGAYLDLPIFYAYRPEVNRAKIILEKAKTDKISFEKKLEFALKQNFNQFKYAKENMGYYKDILKESDDILKLSTEKYESGNLNLTNLIIIEYTHQDMLNEYISAMQVYYHSYLDLMHNMGHDILLEQDI
ncbi:MAG: TolC family protein [Candidatus Gastranaerophilales bacterium]